MNCKSKVYIRKVGCWRCSPLHRNPFCQVDASDGSVAVKLKQRFGKAGNGAATPTAAPHAQATEKTPSPEATTPTPSTATPPPSGEESSADAAMDANAVASGAPDASVAALAPNAAAAATATAATSSNVPGQDLPS